MLPYLLALVCAAGAPLEQVDLGIQSRAPAVYRLVGYLDSSPPGETVYFRTVIGFGPRLRTYLITRYSRQGDGDPFILFRDLGMFRPDFILLGPKKTVAALIGAESGSRVTGTFVYRVGTHVLEVDAHSIKIE